MDNDLEELMVEMPEEFIKEQLNVLASINKVIAEVVDASPFDIDSELYLLWMYGVEPFAEA